MNARSKILTLVMLIIFLAFVGIIIQQSMRRSRRSDPVPLSIQIAGNRVGASSEKRIELAQRAIEQSPNKIDGYNLLAAALMQKARDTSDFSFNARAEAALTRSFELEPENYDAIKLHAKLLLTYHRFGDALSAARHAQSLRPNDHDNYGAITDALVELGDYEGAIEAAQRMVDLRPDSASYARVSYLRSLHGDPVGAIDAMSVAVKAANPNDPEGAAWCRVHLGDELMNAGKKRDAEREYDNALFIFPEYPLALAAKARARMIEGDYTQAIQLYERAQNRVPLPDTAIALGDLYAKVGRPEDSRYQYELVDFVERDSAASGTYSRQLAMFWVDHGEKLSEALAIAERERSMRKDIYTCDALGWILLKNGRVPEAKKSIDEALRLKTRDARLLFHAGIIYKALGDRLKAKQYLTQALQINPSFDVFQSDVAREALAELQSGHHLTNFERASTQADGQ